MSTREELLLEQAAEMLAAAGRALNAATELVRLAKQDRLFRLFKSNGYHEASASAGDSSLRSTSSAPTGPEAITPDPEPGPGRSAVLLSAPPLRVGFPQGAD